MIKINKNSWHYKLLERTCSDIPDDLCPYMRKLLGVVGYLIINIGVVLIGVAGLVGLAIADFWGFLKILFVSIIIIVLAGAGISLLCWLLIDKLAGRFPILEVSLGEIFDKVSLDVKLPTSDTIKLIKDYLKAKHDKFCPKVEFIDD